MGGRHQLGELVAMLGIWSKLTLVAEHVLPRLGDEQGEASEEGDWGHVDVCGAGVPGPFELVM
jgi:hypothetical protein